MQIKFQTETCGRCGGSGTTPWKHVEGGRCFGCAGNGSRLTAAGRRAKDAYDAAMLERTGLPAQEIKPGDVVISAASKFMTEFGVRARTVREVTTQTYKRRAQGSDEWETVTNYCLTFDGEKCAIYEHGKLVRRPDWQASLEIKPLIAKRFRKGATLVEDEPQPVAA